MIVDVIFSYILVKKIDELNAELKGYNITDTIIEIYNLIGNILRKSVNIMKKKIKGIVDAIVINNKPYFLFIKTNINMNILKNKRILLKEISDATLKNTYKVLVFNRNVKSRGHDIHTFIFGFPRAQLGSGYFVDDESDIKKPSLIRFLITKENASYHLYIVGILLWHEGFIRKIKHVGKVNKKRISTYILNIIRGKSLADILEEYMLYVYEILRKKGVVV